MGISVYPVASNASLAPSTVLPVNASSVIWDGQLIVTSGQSLVVSGNGAPVYVYVNGMQKGAVVTISGATVNNAYTVGTGVQITASGWSGNATISVGLPPYSPAPQPTYPTTPTYYSTGTNYTSWQWTCVVGGNGNFVALPGFSATSTITYSTNSGASFNTVGLSYAAAWGAGCFGIPGGTPYFYIVGDYQGNYSTTNIAPYNTNGAGNSWSYATLPYSTYWSGICYGAWDTNTLTSGMFVAIGGWSGSSGAYALSTTPTTWTAFPLPVAFTWCDIAGGVLSGTPTVLTYWATSTNTSYNAYCTVPSIGSNPSSWTSTAGLTYGYGRISYGNGSFVVMFPQNSTNIMNYSQNPIGVGWTTGYLPYSTYWARAAWCDGWWLAVGGWNNASTSYAAICSGNNYTWTAISWPGNYYWTSVAASNGNVTSASGSGVSANFCAVAASTSVDAYTTPGQLSVPSPVASGIVPTTPISFGIYRGPAVTH